MPAVEDATRMADEPKAPLSGATRIWAVVERIGLKSLATGNFGWFVLLVVAASIVWKLDSADLKEVLLKVASQVGWIGYVIAPVSIFISVKILNWRERFYQEEMRRVVEVRNKAVQAKFELQLQSSVEKNKSNENDA